MQYFTNHAVLIINNIGGLMSPGQLKNKLPMEKNYTLLLSIDNNRVSLINPSDFLREEKKINEMLDSVLLTPSDDLMDNIFRKCNIA